MHITTVRTDEQLQFIADKKKIGFVDENELFGIGPDGYSIRIASVRDITEAKDLLIAWKKKVEHNFIEEGFKKLKDELKP